MVAGTEGFTSEMHQGFSLGVKKPALVKTATG